jgi:gamma-glutamyl hercynylcysteine S-oxide synthase
VTLAETPAHRVSLSPYYIDQLEVTVGQVVFWLNATKSENQCGSQFYGYCVSLAPDATSPITRKGGVYVADPGSDRLPSSDFTYEGAQAYCEWAGKRLPTEAEWEFAARHDPATGKDLVYPWGDTFEPKRANCDERDCADGYEREAPVGSLADVSPWGVEDMAGNMYEITGDCWDWKLYSCKGVCRDPKGHGVICMERTARGGYWGMPRSHVRAAVRGPAPAIGNSVRCAR